MKQIISLLLFLAAGLCFTACEKEEKIDLSTPVLRFSEIVYSLGTTTPLEVRLTSSRPMEQNTTVPFDVQGAAIEGEEYELSAKDFRFATGDTAASRAQNIAESLFIWLVFNASYRLKVTSSTCSPMKMSAKSAVLYHAGLPGMVSYMGVPLITSPLIFTPFIFLSSL